METKHLKKYAPEARREFIEAVTNKAAVYGLLPKDEVLPMQEEGDVVIIGDRPFPRSVAKQRKELEERIRKEGFQQFIEAIAYTWFNRFVAIRYMEFHGYLDHGYRVLSHPEGKSTPEILENAERIELPGLKRDEVVDLKLDGDKDEQLYQMLLLAQCNALHKAMPFLFESIKDGTELLLPDNLLHTDSLVRTLVNNIPEEQWKNVEIIGWLYQFYISEKKEEVIGKVVKSEDIPAATQLFTPNWIVKYLVQNSLGRQWVATYPDSPLKQQMEFYIEPAEQSTEVQQQLNEITPDGLDPEELTLLDPACGSGHILVEAYDLFKAIYSERGYRPRDIPKLILTKNLFGLEIDDRAAQLSAFALMMKARTDDRGIFGQDVQPNVLSIQESKGLDAKEITDALNEAVLVDEPPPSGELFDEIADEKSPLLSRKNLSKAGDISQADVAHLIDLFEDGKTFGSLIQIPETLSDKLPEIAFRIEHVMKSGKLLEQAAATSFQPIVRQANVLCPRYNAVVANPPYIGSKGMNTILKRYAKEHYADFKADAFAMFINRCAELTSKDGSVGLMTPFVWMFIRTYLPVRKLLVEENTIHSLVHPEYHAFFDSAYVPICTFVFDKRHIDQTGHYFDLREFYGADQQPKKLLEAIRHGNCGWHYKVAASEFTHIPGEPLVYWLPRSLRDCFDKGVKLEHVAEPRIGMATCDNERFLRLWFEVPFSSIKFHAKSRTEALESGRKWFPHHKGGEFRRWYGNLEYVVNWENDGHELQTTKHPTADRVRAHNFNLDQIFKPAIVWTSVTSSDPSFRLSEHGFLYDAASGLCPVKDDANTKVILGILNSSLVNRLQPALNPTLNLVPGDLNRIPVLLDESMGDLSENVDKLIELYKTDWNLLETAWDYARNPLLSEAHQLGSLVSSYHQFTEDCSARRHSALSHEVSCNRIISAAYQVVGDIPTSCLKTDLPLHEPSEEDECLRLISYSIGCMMGRYSLDEPGLIYAHSGNAGFDVTKYNTFPADEDGIIPITDTTWFSDDAANRFERFVRTGWPEEYLEDNLCFVSQSIGKRKGEASRECIRRYLATGFYKHHLSMYKKRPIYWLFSSGKQRAFQCLVYLHRYNAGTLSRMRTEYVVKLQGKINSRIDQLEDDIPAANNTSHRKKLEKERDILVKQREELQEFDEKLRHYADQRIELDLDDGVKVNYGKFGDLLADVKSITGRNPIVEVTS